jgi:hypothetical protein
MVGEAGAVVTVVAPAGRFCRANGGGGAGGAPAALGRATAGWKGASQVTAEAEWVAKAGTPT